MPNWNEILLEIRNLSSHAQAQANRAQTLVRQKYLQELHQKTGRNIIAYYSGFLSKPTVRGIEITDEDKNGFMTTVHKLDRSKGLDLILHTPGGGIASTKSIVNYLQKMFRATPDEIPDIRAIVPQIAMSAGTMIACSCKELWMGKQSNIGPIDPQVNGVPAYGVLKEFKDAFKDVKQDIGKIPIWQSIIGQYRPTFLSRCENAIQGSNQFVREQLASVMFKGVPHARKTAARIVKSLTHYTKNKGHDRHIHFEECKDLGLVVRSFEDDGDDAFQDLVLTVHHCYMHLLMNTHCFKIIENHMGVGITKNVVLPEIQQPQ